MSQPKSKSHDYRVGLMVQENLYTQGLESIGESKKIAVVYDMYSSVIKDAPKSTTFARYFSNMYTRGGSQFVPNNNILMIPDEPKTKSAEPIIDDDDDNTMIDDAFKLELRHVLRYCMQLYINEVPKPMTQDEIARNYQLKMTTPISANSMDMKIVGYIVRMLVKQRILLRTKKDGKIIGLNHKPFGIGTDYTMNELLTASFLALDTRTTILTDSKLLFGTQKLTLTFKWLMHSITIKNEEGFTVADVYHRGCAWYFDTLFNKYVDIKATKYYPIYLVVYNETGSNQTHHPSKLRFDLDSSQYSKLHNSKVL